MLRCAVIGAGFIGEMHMKAISKLDDCELIAVSDVNEAVGEKLASDFGCKHYIDAEEMFKKEALDVVHICLPTFLHEKFTLLAAQYGAHVLCEKPFSLTLEAAKRMAEACEKANVKLMVAQVARWWPEFEEFKKLYDKDTFGDLHMVYSNRLAQHPNWATWHRDPAKSGGALYDLCLHNIDYLFSLFGDVKSVYAVGWKSPSGCWNHVTTSLVFKNGVKAVDEGSCEFIGDFPFTFSLRVAGDKATFDYKFSAGHNIENLDAATSQTYLYEKDKPVKMLEFPQFDAYEAEIRDFVDSIINDKPLPVPIADSIEVIRIMGAIEKSLETGEIVLL